MTEFIQFLRFLAMLMLANAQPTQVPLETWVERAMPYYESVTGVTPVSEVSLSYTLLPGRGAETVATTAGCTGEIRLDARTRGDHIELHNLAHELGHVHQGAACGGLFRAVNAWPHLYLTRGDRTNLEQVAELIALEVNAERAIAGEPGAEYEFWYQVYWMTNTAAPADLYYHSGPLKRLYQSQGGAVAGAGMRKPLVMSSTWSMLEQGQAYYERLMLRVR